MNRQRILPAVIWACFIIYLSVARINIQLPEVEFLTWDKVAHAFVYGVLSFYIIIGQRNNRYFWIWPLLIPIILGVAMEYVQANFFPYRYFEWGDALANALGSILVVVVASRVMVIPLYQDE